MLTDWLEVRRKSKTEYEIYDVIAEDTVTISSKEAKRLLKLDGMTDPALVYPEYSKAELKKLLYTYEDYGYIRTDRFVVKEFPEFIYSLVFPKVTKELRMFCKILNLILMVIWPVLLFVGIKHYLLDGDLYLHDINYVSFQLGIGMICGILFGSIFHECGHAISGVAYGGDICEMGVMLHLLLPGAYVMLNDRKVKGRFQRIQIFAAGVEMNVLYQYLFLYSLE